MKNLATTPIIRETFSHFLALKQAENLSQASLDNYIISLQVFLADNGLDDESSISVFSPAMITRWSAEQLSAGCRAIASINHYLRDMRVYINFLIDNYELSPFTVKLLREPRTFKERYTDEELSKLLVEPRRSDIYSVWRTWLIICTMLATGLRIGSACYLKKNDIQNGKIIVRHTKNGDELILPLSDNLLVNIRKYLSVWNLESEYLFLSSREGRILTPNCAYQALKDYCAERSVRCLGWHAFRHTFAYLAWKSGMDIVTLQRYLQHSTVELTRRYIGSIGADDIINSRVPLDLLIRKKHIHKNK